MTPEQLLNELQQSAGLSSTTETGPDSLIGFFQSFRPDGQGLQNFFANFPGSDFFSVSQSVGEDLDERLAKTFEVASSGRRPQGGQDAYFLVRNPKPLAPDRAAEHARRWLECLSEFAISVGESEVAKLLSSEIRVRVLEGLPPKSPKLAEEKTELLLAMQDDVPDLVNRVDAGPLPQLLSKAYYFIACDPMLRDYLMWPLFQSAAAVTDPFADYFQLWCHGVKYRIFQPDQIDIYLPRQNHP